MPEPATLTRRVRPGRRLKTLGRQWGWLVAVLLVVGFIAAVAAVANGRGARGGAVGEATVTTTTTAVPTAGGSAVAPVATAKRTPTTRSKTQAPKPTAPVGLATMALTALPPEASDTWKRVEAGGPFPYREDGVAYENREHKLPDQPLGWYREYTVVTPGASDRGPRRLVVGTDKSPFWTPDGGASFVFVDVSR
jgi:ribonuclease T1